MVKIQMIVLRDKDDERRGWSGCRHMRVRAVRSFRHILVPSICLHIQKLKPER